MLKKLIKKQYLYSLFIAILIILLSAENLLSKEIDDENPTGEKNKKGSFIENAAARLNKSINIFFSPKINVSPKAETNNTNNNTNNNTRDNGKNNEQFGSSIKNEDKDDNNQNEIPSQINNNQINIDTRENDLNNKGVNIKSNEPIINKEGNKEGNKDNNKEVSKEKNRMIVDKEIDFNIDQKKKQELQKLNIDNNKRELEKEDKENDKDVKIVYIEVCGADGKKINKNKPSGVISKKNNIKKNPTTNKNKTNGQNKKPVNVSKEIKNNPLNKATAKEVVNKYNKKRIKIPLMQIKCIPDNIQDIAIFKKYLTTMSNEIDDFDDEKEEIKKTNTTKEEYKSKEDLKKDLIQENKKEERKEEKKDLLDNELDMFIFQQNNKENVKEEATSNTNKPTEDMVDDFIKKTNNGEKYSNNSDLTKPNVNLITNVLTVANENKDKSKKEAIIAETNDGISKYYLIENEYIDFEKIVYPPQKLSAKIENSDNYSPLNSKPTIIIEEKVEENQKINKIQKPTLENSVKIENSSKQDISKESEKSNQKQEEKKDEKGKKSGDEEYNTLIKQYGYVQDPDYEINDYESYQESLKLNYSNVAFLEQKSKK